MKIGRHFITPTWGDIKIWTNKSFEYQFEFGERLRKYFFPQMFYVNCYRHHGDHKGFGIEVSLLKLVWINFNIHDHRHWDYENNCYFA